MTKVAIIVLIGAWRLTAQETPQAQTRGAWNREFQQAREAAQQTRPTSPAPAPRLPVARTPAGAAVPLYLGATMWGLTPAVAASSEQRGFVHAKSGENWSAQRLDRLKAVREGERVRFAIEASRDGYLYVIDQDVFRDGTRGEPTLRFPTARIRGGRNAVIAGRPVEIPDPADSVPYLTVERTRPDQTAIAISLLWSPEPFRELDGFRDAMPLRPERLARWQREWGVSDPPMDDPAQVGAWYTAQEQAAGSGASLLAAAGPLPQTLFRARVAHGHPVFVTYVIRLE